jgi:hypothetical protein
MMILVPLLLANFMLVAQDEPKTPRVICTSTGPAIPLGQGPTTVKLKCCPNGQYVKSVDEHGDLVCSRDEKL